MNERRSVSPVARRIKPKTEWRAET